MPILFSKNVEYLIIKNSLRQQENRRSRLPALPETTVKYLQTLGYAADHKRKVLAVIEGRQTQAQTVLQFTPKTNLQGGDLEDSGHTPGEQTGTGPNV